MHALDELEHLLLQLLHKLPVVLAQIVAEVRLAGIDGLAANLADKGVRDLKMAAHKLLLAASRANLHADLLAARRLLAGLVVDLNALDDADVDHALGRHAQRCSLTDNALLDDDADDNGVARVEYAIGQDTQAARKDCDVLVSLAQLAFELLGVRLELIEKMVDDVGRKNLQATLISHSLRVAVDGHVEGQHHTVLLVLVHLDRGLHHVALVHWPDADVCHRHLLRLQEVHHGFQRAQRRCLHGKAAVDGRNRAQRRLELARGLLHEQRDLVLVLRNKERQTGNRSLEVLGGDLDALRGADLGVRLVCVLDAHFLQGSRHQQRADLRDDRPFKARQHNCIALAQESLRQDDVNGAAVAVDDLDLEHRALQVRAERHAVCKAALRQVGQHEEQVGHALACHGRGGDDVDILAVVLIVPVQLAVDALLGKLQLDHVQLRVEVLHGALLLLLQGVLDRSIRRGNPFVQAINLVHGDDERHFLVAQHLQRFNRLLLETAVCVDDEDRNVAQRRPARAQVVEGLVAGGVDDHQAGDLQLKALRLLHALDPGGDLVVWHKCGTDLLCDTASLALLHVRAANVVEQLGLAGVDVAQDGNDCRPQHVRCALSLRLGLAVLDALLNLLRGCIAAVR
eukprot:m.88781 g.88781  ORF g.88781 m.88781 type:complete len:627 (-) comp8382_c6_seq1:70-1950(-)